MCISVHIVLQRCQKGSVNQKRNPGCQVADRLGGVDLPGNIPVLPRPKKKKHHGEKERRRPFFFPRRRCRMSLALSRPRLLQRVSQRGYGYGYILPTAASTARVSALAGIRKGPSNFQTNAVKVRARLGMVHLDNTDNVCSMPRQYRTNRDRQNRSRISVWKVNSRRIKISGST